jgi:[acyl-carrier-protein] S-malonyltransferase
MGKIAFVFPGQGAQAVGMGQDVYGAHSEARRLFERADEVLGLKLSEIIFHGPEEQLKQTYNTQPALLTTSMALYEVFKEHGIHADYAAGHSLGEYSALVAAGVVSFEDAVRTVRLRGQYMEQAVPGGKGTMAAVLGADRDKLAEICAAISGETGIVELANVNCPGQIVVSGSIEGVQAVQERAKEAGAKRVIPLEVSGPFHSSIMKSAAERLAETLADIELRAASIPVIANVTAREVRDAEEIRRLLVEQVYSPVLWEDSVAWMIEQGVDTFVEIGPGSVLSGLIKKIDRNVRIFTVNSMESAQQTGEQLKALAL